MQRSADRTAQETAKEKEQEEEEPKEEEEEAAKKEQQKEKHVRLMQTVLQRTVFKEKKVLPVDLEIMFLRQVQHR